MKGILNILKPPGMTSHDVVGYVRRITGIKKAGHTGTLDPGAAGVLPVCLGGATRVIQYLPSDKRYRAEVTFGVSTTTQDAFGEVTRCNLPKDLSIDTISRCLLRFKGNIQQVPPMVSAVRHRGKRLYELARAGIEVERKPRNVTVYEINLLHSSNHSSGLPKVIFEVKCSAGTYIRTICHELGASLGCGAFMSFLLRLEAGSFKLEGSITLEELKANTDNGTLHKILIPIEAALRHLPAIRVSVEQAGFIANGNKLRLPVKFLNEEIRNGQHLTRVESPEGLLLALAQVGSSEEQEYYMVKPVKVFAQV